jgi:hypothetical protein
LADREYRVGPNGPTLQEIWGTVRRLDFNGYNVKILIEDNDDPYSGLEASGPLRGVGRPTQLTFQGNGSHLHKTTVNGFYGEGGAMFTVSGCKIQAVYSIYGEGSGTQIAFNNVLSDGVSITNSIHFYARRGAYLEQNGNVFILGGGTPDAALSATHGGRLWQTSGVFGYFGNINCAKAMVYGLSGGEIVTTGTAYHYQDASAAGLVGKQYVLQAAIWQWIPAGTLIGSMQGVEADGGKFISVAAT